MLLSPGVTQDPRSLTSATNGDLSFGGLRGFQNSFLVDGGDFNNAFFAQARGLYRAPYQFSNEVVQEFRVSSNSYGAEKGRAGGAVMNVVTKSGTNHWHGTGLYYIRDSAFRRGQSLDVFQAAQQPAARRSNIGGPIKKNKIFFFGGFDQHYFHVPDVVEFLDGSMQVVPQAGTGPYSPGDYEASDQALVFAAAAQLTSLAGSYPAAQIGNASYSKLDINLTPRNQLALRYNSSRYWGSNNVFLDPASPVNYDSISNNGKKRSPRIPVRLRSCPAFPRGSSAISASSFRVTCGSPSPTPLTLWSKLPTSSTALGAPTNFLGPRANIAASLPKLSASIPAGTLSSSAATRW